MALGSTSTDEEIEAQWDDNVDYDLVGSLPKCRLFVAAGRLLLRRLADETQGYAGARIRADRTVMERQLSQAENWLRANDPTGGRPVGANTNVTGLSLEGFR